MYGRVLIYNCNFRCYDQDEYPTSHRDEFIVSVFGSNQQPAQSTFQSLTTGFVVNPTLGTVLNNPGLNPDTINFVLKEVNRREVDDDDDGLYKIISVVQFTSKVSCACVETKPLTQRKASKSKHRRKQILIIVSYFLIE